MKRSHFVKYVCHEVLDVRLDYILRGRPFFAPVCRWSAVTAGRSFVFQATRAASAALVSRKFFFFLIMISFTFSFSFFPELRSLDSMVEGDRTLCRLWNPYHARSDGKCSDREFVLFFPGEILCATSISSKYEKE